MNKYKIVELGAEKSLYLRYTVCESCKPCKCQYKFHLPAGILYGARIGDIVREYCDKNKLLSIPVAYSCNNRLSFCMKPRTVSGISVLAESLTKMEKMRHNLGMYRALRHKKSDRHFHLKTICVCC